VHLGDDCQFTDYTLCCCPAVRSLNPDHRTKIITDDIFASGVADCTATIMGHMLKEVATVDCGHGVLISLLLAFDDAP
jgi:hypothetical protein